MTHLQNDQPISITTELMAIWSIDQQPTVRLAKNLQNLIYTDYIWLIINSMFYVQLSDHCVFENVVVIFGADI